MESKIKNDIIMIYQNSRGVKKKRELTFLADIKTQTPRKA